jgi:hypothetical protein
MLTATTYFHDTRFLSILTILAAILAVLLWRTIARRVSALVLLVLSHLNTPLSNELRFSFMLRPAGARVKLAAAKLELRRANNDCALLVSQI